MRVRVADNKAFITIKGGGHGAARPEFEYEIPCQDGEQLLTICLDHVIDKTRHIVMDHGNQWEVDLYHGRLQGLITAELEIPDENYTYPLPDFYMVMATQNPIDQEGTYRLPEAQMDRFLLKVTVGYPSVESELKILHEYHKGNNLHEVRFNRPVLTLDELRKHRGMLKDVVVDDSLMKYLCNIVAATRNSVYTWIGGSPRASIALLQTAKAHAILSGRDFVTPDDIHFLAPYVLAHRVTLTAEAELNGMTVAQLVKQIIDSVAINN